jgi:nicotinate-nucleotide adenylyltransferase
MPRVGLFGGTFDPIHVGHLDVIDAAAHALQLDRVLLMPANVPPHRAAPQASAAHRFAMAVLAVADRDTYAVSDLEMLSTEPSFTSATLARIHDRGVDTRELFVITGADAFREIGTWKDFPALLDRSHFVVVSRPGSQASALRGHLPDLAGRMIDPPPSGALLPAPAIVLVDALTSPVSSTDIRRRVAKGDAIDGMVPPLVAEHIRKHQLYKGNSSVYGQI